MGIMEAVTAVLTITLPIIITNMLTNRQTQCLIRKMGIHTQRLIENSNRQTLKLLREIKTTQEGIKQVQEDTRCLLGKMHRCLLKLDFGFEANARMHGWRRVDDISPEQARKLPEPKVYNRKLRICYYRG